MDTSRLTICSVAFHSREYLKLNLKLMTRLNKGNRWTWIIVNNSSDEIVDFSDDRCMVIEGVPRDLTKPKGGSNYHHAAALNKSLGYINTRFALFLDPDFFIVRQRWIDDVIAYMTAAGLSFFGAPWHPKWHIKYRYFPCPHCLFVDLDKVSIQSLDFTPEPRPAIEQKPRDNNNHRVGKIKQKIPVAIKRVLRPISKIVRIAHFLNLEQRRQIGSSRDTGYRIFRQYRQNLKMRYRCVVPVFRSRVDFRGPKQMLSWPARLAEIFFPDHLSYIPKRPGYYVQTCFRDLGYPDVSAMGWEEFLWQDKPFGFHIRSYQQDQHDLEKGKRQLASVIDKFLL